MPVQVTHPEGAYTHITRDVFGKPTILRRSNNSSHTGGTVAPNRTYTYNQTGESVKRGSDAAWAIGYGYNANGVLSSLVYPSSLTVNYAPNALGQPTQAGSYATGVSYFPNGAIKQFTYGNGVVHTLSQNARGLPARSTDCTLAGTCASANRRLDLQYAYDEHGNVSDITDHALGGRQTRGMSYDALDRLIQTTSGSTVFDTASYAYDVLDNLSTVHVSGGSQSRNHTYAYDPATWRLSQVKNTVGGTVVANLTYDVQGNLATKGAQTYQFDLGNRLRSVPGKEASYEYDGHGRRVYAQTVGSGQIVSQYAGSGPLLYQENHKQAKRIDYVYMGSSLVAFRERPLSGTTATVKYQHTDALGSPVAVTNAAKVLIESSEYEPYGQVVNKPLFDGPGYTGHVQDAATGLTYMQQRYYDPQLGVFLSVDPVTAHDAKDWRLFHRYAYAFNNPYGFTDPDGRRASGENEPSPPPEPTTIETITVRGDPSSSLPQPRIPSFFRLTTTETLRRDRSAEQAIEDGVLTRTVTLPAMIVTASPSAISIGSSAAPSVGSGMLVVGRAAVDPRSVRSVCLAAGIGASFCNGRGFEVLDDLLQKGQQRREAREGVVRETRERADKREVSQ
ncbi:hypothetical protein GCM10011394_21210 [Luteimonas terricola]|uniref:Teneurin-like YD-shell domain-containing protein n=1 Tax=Luteimonas terricola TaxID=645597 RepID=A0ABQ2EJU5_9GAMM|nr:hypothetical protein GCM10011394_21210 [Luteimonas terricola]